MKYGYWYTSGEIGPPVNSVFKMKIFGTSQVCFESKCKDTFIFRTILQ